MSVRKATYSIAGMKCLVYGEISYDKETCEMPPGCHDVACRGGKVSVLLNRVSDDLQV